VLIVPGLGDSPPGHWQNWLQAQHRDAVRVVQREWHVPDIDRWASCIADTIERAGPGRWLAVAHSFGALALARHLALNPGTPVAAALLVAPAEPDKFSVSDLLPQGLLPVASTLVASDTDPWMTAASTRRWARRWGSQWICLGDAGHINREAGFGTLPLANRWLDAMTQRIERAHRLARASVTEWSFAV